MARSLRCPRCSTIVTVAEGQTPICPACGFGGPAQPAPPVAPTPPPTGGFSAPPPGPGYAQQQQQFQMGQPAWGAPQGRNDGMAVAALVLGCLGWMSIPGLIMSILAIVFGSMSLGRMKRDPSLRGHGMAVAGIVLGSIFLAIWLLLFLFLGALIGGLAGAWR